MLAALVCCFCWEGLGAYQCLEFAHVPKADEVRYLGIFLDATGSGNRTVNTRISKSLPNFSIRFSLTGGVVSKWKLVIYRSVLLSILSYAVGSYCIKPVHMQRVNKLHFQHMRRILDLKSPCYHRVIQPSNIPCSQHASFQRLKLLGLCTPPPGLKLEYTYAFVPPGAYRLRHARGSTGLLGVAVPVCTGPR